MSLYQEIVKELDGGKSICLRTELRGESGKVPELRRSLEPVTPQQDAKGHIFAGVQWEREEDGDSVLLTPMMPHERLILLGGGHIAVALSDIATRCGFAVTVVDDRPAFANDARFPQAQRVICGSFSDVVPQLRITPFDFVVVITRGHQHDADCLRAILTGDQPHYLGQIGSRRRVRAMFDMLEGEGYSRAYLDRICTPIGLNIGAITPEEISVSIMAELIAYKYMPEHSSEGRVATRSDLDIEMIRHLAEDHAPKAVATIISAKGSTPRGAGSMMTVDAHGRITGTIGGGCAEGDIIRRAVDIIGTGKWELVEVDMTDDVKDEEGMACGGVATVLLEDGSEV